MEDLEAQKKPRGLKDGIYTEDSGLPPPQNPDGGILKPKRMVKKANGGYVKAADGVAQRGKTRGKMC
jgi:hypothetical protein